MDKVMIKTRLLGGEEKELQDVLEDCQQESMKIFVILENVSY